MSAVLEREVGEALPDVIETRETRVARLTFPTPREMAADIGLVYDRIPEWMTPREWADILGLLSSSGVRTLAKAGKIEGTERIQIGGIWYNRIPRDGAIKWAWGRRRGRPPLSAGAVPRVMSRS